MINPKSIKLITRAVVGLLLLSLLVSCSRNEGEIFRNPSADETGLYFVNKISETDDLNILDYLYFYDGGGVAVGDIDNDGLVDIYFSGNQVKNKLFLNKGDLNFEDITETAMVAGNSTWNTGAVMGDINGDGLLDIYVCAVVGLNGFNGFNELYINNGDLTFTESAAQYGLDFESYSSSAVFLDYDLDGDLDMYILNHAVHTQESFGKAELRNKRNYQTGDKLMRNDNGKFTDVSSEAGIYGGVNGYGLSVSVSDFNQDGFPDLYVCNDFHEDDYYYLNNGDGTFSERLKEFFGHTSRFSMGNDVADINHDAWPDIFSLDMLPEDEKVLKASDGDESIQTLNLRVKQFGYHYQFTRNMLQINQPNSNFVETALLSGVAATDWSWSGLFADFNQDGEQDLFVSNGIPKRPNNLDFIKFVSNDQIKKKINNTRLVDQEAIDMMPSGKVHNYVFKGTDDIIFENMSGNWMVKDSLISGASALGDFDNDGDLDLVVNNINDPASLYINKTNEKANFVKIKFDYKKPNKFGIGTKVISYHQGKLQYKELYTARGFQASSEPILHFGYHQSTMVDSLRVIWPDNTSQVHLNIETNQTLVIKPERTELFDYKSLQPETKSVFKRVENNLGIDFTHIENRYIDFNRQKLIPYQVSDLGPAVAIGDLNNDQLDDIYLGGAKRIPSTVFLQTEQGFVETKIVSFSKDSIKEDVYALIADFNNDGENDLFVSTGSAESDRDTMALSDSYYLMKNKAFEPADLAGYFENAAVIKANDIDQDGDLDIFVGNHTVSGDFGKIPSSYLLKNENGKFSIVKNTALQQAGMITDAVWNDFDGDGVKDLIVVGEWMKPKFFKNDQGILKEINKLNSDLNGLWQSIQPFDIDKDGDTDYLLGNWGVNNKFIASKEFPMKMYYDDIDNNGKTETIVAIEKGGKYYPLYGLDELSGQIIRLRKKFTSYNDFAGKTVEEVFEKELLNKSKLFTVSMLHSGYLKNDNGNFSFVPFPTKLQVSPITSFLSFDFDNDGDKEVLAAGNYFGVQPYHGRFDSFSGALIESADDIVLGNRIGIDLTEKSVRHLNIIRFKNKPYLMITINNDKAQVLELTNY